ncbi:GerMN domain-containing protein [Pseudobutyrivibrio sp. MD2005]|uniref:GerMN domain-containing protein n=1 Tax=Pseudobutyrivibrio sp. MD2005 TaxID=1410616 RepID=UPI0006884210|nr:GerMN domain-containing protein [Pseudobutyrivibrio sp. MD2005]
MKKSKIAISLLLSLVLALGLVGCKGDKEKPDYAVYYIRTDKNGIAPVGYDFKSSDTDGMISEALNELTEDVDDIKVVNTIPSGVKVKNWELNDGSLGIYLVGDYEALDVYTEILVRAAIVKTLVQIDGVDSVSIYVNNAPLTDANGESVGPMTADTFIEDFGQETDALLSTELTLYFASADGMSTVAETREVYYSRNVTLDRIVIEQLLKGPDNDTLLSALPSGTKLNSITVSEDGVCIVNFDAAIETSLTGVTENVTIYSIVNSLTELDNVKSVQILVNGNTPHISNVDVDLSSAISRNEDIISTLSDEEEPMFPEEQEFSDEEYIDMEE